MLDFENLKNEYLKKLLKNNSCAQEVIGNYTYLLNNVINNINENIELTKENLYQKSNIDNLIREFVDDQMLTSGLVISFGSSSYSKTIYYGYSQEYSCDHCGNIIFDKIYMKENSIFDLASISKVFTCYTVMKLYEKGFIDIDLPVYNYDKRFVNISNYTLREILSFQSVFVTDKLITKDMLLNEAESLLFNIHPKDITLRPYSDMGSIIAKYVIENVLKQDFFEIVKQCIINPCKLNNTFIQRKTISSDLFVSNNFERRILSKECVVDCDTLKGIVHDSKAKIFGKMGLCYSGHAGLFADVADMTKFCQNILTENIISKKYIEQITHNYVGFKDANNNYSQYLGILCHTKHPIEKQSEVYKLMSDNAVAQGGYTGTYLTYDIDNNIFLFMGGNRCHNRITSISKNISVENLNLSNIWKSKYVDTHLYAWQRDNLIHKILDLAIQYSFVEYIFSEKSLNPNL